VLRQVEQAKIIAQRTQRGEVGRVDVGFMATAVCSEFCRNRFPSFSAPIRRSRSICASSCRWTNIPNVVYREFATNAVPEIGHSATRCGAERPQICTSLFAIA